MVVVVAVGVAEVDNWRLWGLEGGVLVVVVVEEAVSLRRGMVDRECNYLGGEYCTRARV